MGSPLEIPKISDPTPEQVDEYHEMFKAKLIDFFETEKHKYLANSEGISLTIA